MLFTDNKTSLLGKIQNANWLLFSQIMIAYRKNYKNVKIKIIVNKIIKIKTSRLRITPFKTSLLVTFLLD
ncbi:MAG: hypothetical protein ACJAXS_001072 [Colwellia sp.]|jgi:hypothetical protein